MKIGIVTEEVSLHPPFGGIATASEGLIKALKAAGHEVDLLFFPDTPVTQRDPEAEAPLNLQIFDVTAANKLAGQRASSRSYAAYQALKDTDYDLLLWPDYRGIGYYSMQATRCGSGLCNTRHLVLCYGPLAWCRETSSHLVFNPPQAEVDNLERECYRLADLVVFNSAFLQSWCQQRRYEIARSVVIPSLVPAHFRADGTLRDSSDFENVGQMHAINELAFFGRLESRKGFEVFVDALRLLAKRRDLTDLRVLFFGRPIKNRGVWAHVDIIDKLIDLPIKLFLVDDASTQDFLEYCQSRAVLALTPSIDDNLPGTMIECVNHRIPLLASNCGGAPEIVATEDHAWLCPPEAEALAQRLDRALTEGHPTLKPAHYPQQILSSWIETLTQESSRPPQAAGLNLEVAAKEDVTVGVVHYNRPHMLARALESLLQQTTLPKRLVVIDDNSPCRSELEVVLGTYREKCERLGIVFDTIFNSSNIYLGACRNRILESVDTTWVLFQDDDDVAMPDMLAKLLGIAKAQDADIAVPHLYYLPERGNETTPYEQVVASPKQPTWFFRGPDVDWGPYGNPFGPACSLFRTQAMKEVGAYTELIGVGFEDYELLYKMALRGYRFAIHVDAMFAYRINPDSMAKTTSKQENFARIFRMLRIEAPTAKRGLNPTLLCEYVFTHQYSKEGAAGLRPKNPLLNQKVKIAGQPAQIAASLRACIDASPHAIFFGKESLDGIKRKPAKRAVPETPNKNVIRNLWARLTTSRPRP